MTEANENTRTTPNSDQAGKEKPDPSEIDFSSVEWLSSPTPEGEDAEGGPVEIAFLDDGNVAMRSGEEPEGPVLIFTPAEWDAFVGGVKDGEFDDLLDDLPEYPPEDAE